MKVIDWRVKGNLVRLFFGYSDIEFYYPKNWDESLLKSSLLKSYDEFEEVNSDDIVLIMDIAVNYDFEVSDPFVGINLVNNNYTKADLVEDPIAPIIIIGKTSRYDLAIWSKNSVKIYMGDTFEEVKKIAEDKRYVMSYHIDEKYFPILERRLCDEQISD